ncbi:hypothetical protein Drose_31440 [Dactylosporangium roseum]|uniref:Flp family type IVb pilin n=1 Tax=Dactylosporangium roseum TaxID=47989 RepID=A0ABY5Z0N1_9ACTN|nr:hypothetical protein [Dactylosporangium roseum]UWZ35586.1 hypothetical protein Drose_31440 [Dactylosporangium roseum]
MTNLLAKLRARSLSGDRGAATVEYGLGAVLAGMTVVAALTLFGGDASTW